MLIEYYRGKNAYPKTNNSSRHPLGVMIAFKNDEGQLRFGWSKCNTKLDRFDKKYGLEIALARADSSKSLNTEIMPDDMYDHFVDFVNRAEKYYKIYQSNFQPQSLKGKIKKEVSKVIRYFTNKPQNSV